MIIEELAIFSVFLFLMYLFAESKPSRIIIGVLASILLIILGYSIVIDGILINSGQAKTIATTGTNTNTGTETLTENSTSCYNLLQDNCTYSSTNTTTLINMTEAVDTTALENATNTYVNINTLSPTAFNYSLSQLIGFVLILLGFFGLFDYGLRIGPKPV